MKKPKLLTSKIIYTIIVCTLASILIAFSTLFSFSINAFFILFITYIFLILNIENKKYLYFYFIKSIKSLFFFLPISGLIYSISITSEIVNISGDGLNQAASGIGGAIGGFLIVAICLIIGLVGGWIIGMFAKEPKMNEEENEGRSLGILFVVLIVLSIYLGIQVSPIEKIFNDTNSGSTLSGEVIN